MHGPEANSAPRGYFGAICSSMNSKKAKFNRNVPVPMRFCAHSGGETIDHPEVSINESRVTKNVHDRVVLSRLQK